MLLRCDVSLVAVRQMYLFIWHALIRVGSEQTGVKSTTSAAAQQPVMHSTTSPLPPPSIPDDNSGDGKLM